MRCRIPLVVSVLVIRGMEGRAAVLKRDGTGQGTPLLLGPPGATSASLPTTTLSASTDESDADITGGNTSPVTLSASTSTSATTSSSSSTSTTSSDSQTSSTTTASATATPLPPSDMHPDPPRQASSIRYLVPVFLLILVTLTVFSVNKYRKRRARSRTRSSQTSRGNDPFKGEGTGGGGWKEIKDEDDDDVWDSREDPDEELRWKSMDLNHSNPYLSMSGQNREIEISVGNSRKSLGVLSVAGKSWGWRDTFENWRSARGRSLRDHTEDDYDDIHGREPTVKLVTPTLATYQTLPQLGYEAVPNNQIRSKTETFHHADMGLGDERERESIRALRDKLTSLSYMTSPPINASKSRLGSGRESTNTNDKMEEHASTSVSAPVPPEWIRPRALSPTQILSPPLHPHLFFHPNQHQHHAGAATAGGGRDRQMFISNTDDGHSCSEYDGTDYGEGESLVNTPVIQVQDQDQDQDQKESVIVKFPRIPSTASALANTFNSRRSFASSTANAIKTDHTIRSKASSSPVKPLKRTPRGKITATNASGDGNCSSGSRLQPPPSPGVSRRSSSKSKSTNSSPSKSVIRRSTATKDLSDTSPVPPSPQTPSRRKADKAEMNSKSGLTPKSPAASATPRKDKTSREKKEQRARDKVEDILKASWSDRALSPPLPASQSQPLTTAGRKVRPTPGNMSPGVDDLAGGIEQRLAMLKKMEG